MELFFHPPLSHRFRKDPTVFLACSWILGLIGGILFSFDSYTFFVPLMRQVPSGPVSIVGLLSAILLPVLLSAAAVSISCVWLLFPIAALKAFSYAFVCFGTLVSYGTAGWLIRLLLLFSDTLSLPVLWLFWLASLRKGRSGLTFRLLPVISALFLICSIDLCVISPFLADILSL